VVGPRDSGGESRGGGFLPRPRVGVSGEGERRKELKGKLYTGLISLLVPRSITGHVLRLVVLLLLAAAVEHLLEELELCECEGEEGE